MDDDTLDRLLSGDLTRLPKLPKRVVRLFISSTFTDMTLERNSLMERVYPRLKKYCRERHGLDFQVVDMRWGVRDEATDDHQTVSLCSREIDNCQRVSLGPNFIALIGDKYGFRPLLNRIKSAEYRLLRRCLIESDINTDFLDTWYKEDLNATPAEYLLQPISSILKNFTNKNEPELQMVDQRIWQAIQERLHDLLLIGSDRLVRQGRMSEREQKLKYSISVTEREVLEGCLSLNDAKSHCLVYVRSIEDLRANLSKCLAGPGPAAGGGLSANNLNLTSSGPDSGEGGPGPRRDSSTRKASLKIGEDSISLMTSVSQTASERKVERSRRLIGRYIDLTSKNGEWQVDEEAQSALRELKEVKLANRLASNGRNLSVYQVHWNEQDGISLKSEEHKNYLKHLTDHFYANLTRMVRSAVRSERSGGNASGLAGEVLRHSHHALLVGKSVYGRQDELEQIRAYILSGGQYLLPMQQHQQRPNEVQLNGPVLPMLLFGVSGSGKSSILARVAGQAHEWIEEARKRRHSSASLSSNDPLQSSWSVRLRRWDRRPCLVVRFCCTTPASSSMAGMLSGVCRQLQYNFYQFGPLNGLAEQQERPRAGPHAQAIRDSSSQLAFQSIPNDFVRLVYTFRQLVENCRHHLHRRRLFVIILDSIERLSAPAESGVEAKYSWLTSIAQLPPNVRLIVSCSSSGESGTRLDYIHLKRHFLQIHHRALGRTGLGPGLGLLLAGGCVAPPNASDSSEANSDSDSLELASPSDSSIEAPDDGRASASSAPAQTKYGRLLKQLVLPAVRFKRGSRGHAPVRRSPAAKVAPGSETGRLEAAGWPPARTARHLRPDGSAETAGPANDETEDLGRGTRGAGYLGLLHVRPLGKELAVSVLRRWLAQSGRNLTERQWNIVERSFAHCSRPIFVKLALGEVINWKSYSARGDTKGLTFGSSYIMGLPADQAAGGALASICYKELLKILKEHESIGADEEEAGPAVAAQESRFKWQMLAMEQQWLNFLDYEQRLEQQAAAGSNGSAESGNLVIRIGAGSSFAAAAGDPARPLNLSGSLGATGDSPSISICHLSDTIEDAISQLFARIELQHGYLLTKHSLSYITAARNGICENELEDILSLDDVVLDDVFQYHLPPVRRIPPLLWTRIRNDLPDYLSERDADGIVITWHHGQFETVTRKRYLGDRKQLAYIHSLLADYFLGKWADRAKPFRCTRQQIQMAAEQLESAVQQSARDSSSQQGAGLMGARLGSGSGRAGASFSVRSRLRSSDQHDQRLQWTQARAHRRVPQQPLYYESNLSGAPPGGPQPAAAASHADGAESPVSSGARPRYNLRKLTELPHHLLRAGRFRELASCVLFNYKWLIAAIGALGLQSLFVDFEATLECLRAASSSMECERMGATSQPASPGEQEAGECTPSDALDGRELAAMIEQIDLLASALRLSSSIVQGSPHMLAAQLVGRLISVVAGTRPRPANERAPPTDSTQLPLLAALLRQCDRQGAADCALLPLDHCLQSPDGLQLSSLEGHPFAVTSMALARDQRHLLAVSSKFIMWNISTGEIAREIDPKLKGAIMRELAIGLNNQLAVSYTSDNLILVLDILTQQVVKCNPLAGHSPILGLKLLDPFGARRFLVWTRSSFLVFRLDKRGDSPAASPSAGLNPDELLVQLECAVECSKHLAHLEGAGLLAVHLCPARDRGPELVQLVLGSASEAPLRLLVGRMNCGQPSSGCADSIVWWREQIEAPLLALSPSGEQVFYADQHGDVYLRRRRANCWSKPKRVRAAEPAGRPAEQVPEAADGAAGRRTATNRLRTALAIEPDQHLEGADQLEAAEAGRQMSTTEWAQLEDFERIVDQPDEASDEAESAGVFLGAPPDCGAGPRGAGGPRGVRLLKLCWPDCFIIVQLDRHSAGPRHESRLSLPRDVRNVSIGPNKGQLESVLVRRCSQSDERFLVSSAGKRLLVYSVERETLLKCIEAHASRISKLLPIRQTGPAWLQLSVASSSLDKTVKIWNLLNIGKESEPIDRLAGGQVESMCVCADRPLVACLSAGQLSIWDWRTMRIVRLFRSSADLRPAAGEQTAPGAPIVRCKFSQNGRHLAAATAGAVFVLALESSTEQSTAGRPPPAGTDGEPAFRLLASWPTRGHGALVTGLKYLGQDSRLLTVLKCAASGPSDEGRASSSGADSSSSSDTTNSAARAEQADEGATGGQLLRVYCHAVSDSRLLYELSCPLPSRPAAESAAQQAKPRLAASLEEAAGRWKLWALTCDQQFLVVVSAGPPEGGSGGSGATGGQPEVGGRRPLGLSVHSARDGSFVARIDLRRLETAGQEESRNAAPAAKQAPSGARNVLQIGPHQTSSAGPASRSLGRNLGAPANSTRPNWVAIGEDQCKRLKSVRQGDRLALVALIDDERGTSVLVDVAARRLVCHSSSWNGKSLSSDGRYGLSRLFGPRPARADASLGAAGGAGLGLGPAGLRLLEMRHGRPVAGLLSVEQLNRLAGARETPAAPADRDIICHFSRPNDAYVYCCDSRLRRLLLVRLRDSQLIANYKLSSAPTRIKCAADGYALLLALADGSLTSLAIVDGQSNETLARLAQYPSRKRLG